MQVPPQGFMPFDTGAIVARLRAQVPELHLVGGAADYAAVKELAAFRTPSAYVVFAEETNTGKMPTGAFACALECQASFGVVLALRHWREQLGEQLHQDARRLVGAVRSALVGHRPPGARVVGWQSGKVLDYDAGVLLWADVYQVLHMLQRPQGDGTC